MFDRRAFVRSALAFGAGLALPGPTRRAFAESGLPEGFEPQPTLLSMMLRGGPDLRHLIVPPYDDDPQSYGYLYWSNRAAAHDVGATREAWRARFTEGYDAIELGGVRFGVLKKARWLRGRIEAGQVAILSNVLGASSRDHHHAELVYEAGDRGAGPNDLTRDGWGGRLAQAVGGNAVSMINSVRLFINGAHPSDPTQHDNRHVITAPDTRALGLWTPDPGTDPGSRDARSVMGRSLTSYYAAKAQTVPEQSPYRRFIEHERALRHFGALVGARLADRPVPEAIATLYDRERSPLDDRRLGQQMRNVYDSFLSADILNFRVASMLSNGWDSHRDQARLIEPKLQDLFGEGAALDTLWGALGAGLPEALAKTALVVGGEFGRQLRANGDGGTDHGRGMTVLVIGERVRGGLYGDLFPDDERGRFSEPSADIRGRSAIEAVFAALCDGMAPDAGATVFPGAAEAPVEPGVELAGIWRP